MGSELRPGAEKGQTQEWRRVSQLCSLSSETGTLLATLKVTWTMEAFLWVLPGEAYRGHRESSCPLMPI